MTGIGDSRSPVDPSACTGSKGGRSRVGREADGHSSAGLQSSLLPLSAASLGYLLSRATSQGTLVAKLTCPCSATVMSSDSFSPKGFLYQLEGQSISLEQINSAMCLLLVVALD